MKVGYRFNEPWDIYYIFSKYPFINYVLIKQDKYLALQMGTTFKCSKLTSLIKEHTGLVSGIRSHTSTLGASPLLWGTLTFSQGHTARM